MMTVTIHINGEVVQTIDILNRGLPDGRPVPRHGDGTGERRYEWRHRYNGPENHEGTTGDVVHRREDGALVLAYRTLGKITGMLS